VCIKAIDKEEDGERGIDGGKDDDEGGDESKERPER